MQRFLLQFDLSTAEFVTLRVLRREPAPHVMTPSVLHETLVMSAAGISKVLKQLEAKGFVSRKSDSSDKRRNLVQLTPHGKAKITTVQQAVRQFDVDLLGGVLGERDQERLAQLLRKLLVSLEPTKSAAARASLAHDERVTLDA
jgi:DNA-binding MarR family transcriptional regulator